MYTAVCNGSGRIFLDFDDIILHTGISYNGGRRVRKFVGRVIGVTVLSSRISFMSACDQRLTNPTLSIYSTLAVCPPPVPVSVSLSVCNLTTIKLNAWDWQIIIERVAGRFSKGRWCCSEPMLSAIDQVTFKACRYYWNIKRLNILPSQYQNTESAVSYTYTPGCSFWPLRFTAKVVYCFSPHNSSTNTTEF